MRAEWQVETRIEKSAVGNDWLVVEAPSPQPVGFPQHRGFTHALTRPYQMVGTTGNPTVGAIQYYFTRIPEKPFPSVLFSTAIRRSSAPNDPRLLPGNLFIFPGIRFSRPHHKEDLTGFIHHISIRETTNRRLEVYANVNPQDSSPDNRVRFGRRQSLSKDPGLAQVALLLMKDATALDDVGLAMERMTPGAQKAMLERGILSPDPKISNHTYAPLPDNGELAKVPNYLWCGLFLATKPPSRELAQRILWFYLRRLPKSGLKSVKPYDDYEGSFHPQMTVMDLRPVGASCDYPYLICIKCIAPGIMEKTTGMVAAPENISFLYERDTLGGIPGG